MFKEAAFALVIMTPSGTHDRVQSITVERGPCLGTCPVYRFEATADGFGLFEGRRFTAVLGERRFSVTPEAWAAFQAVLAPYRPEGTEDITVGHPRCKQMATDHPSVFVTWTDDGRSDRLHFNFGCRDAENTSMARVLADAPDLLPVGTFIEERHLDEGEYERHPN